MNAGQGLSSGGCRVGAGWWVLVAMALIVLPGCLRRSESIVIHRSGSADVQLIIEGDPDDVRSGDAMPAAAGGWAVTETKRKSRNDKDELVLTASRSVAAGGAWPTTFAESGSPAMRTALTFSTSVRTEPRSDGTYYHFRRVYHARPAARIAFLRRALLESDDMEELMQRDPAELTAEQRKTWVERSIMFEQERSTVFIDQAAAAMGEALAPHHWLPARAAARKPFDDPALQQRALEALSAGDEVGARLEQFDRELSDRVEQVISASLREAGVTETIADRFLAEYRQARAHHEVTDDLGDEEFILVVEMPGVVVAHNSRDEAWTNDEPGDEKPAGGLHEQMRAETIIRQPNRAAWSFRGDELRDYDMVLLATSFVKGG